MNGRAKLSGVETEIVLAVVYTLRDGKIVRGREYLNRGEALKALSAEGDLQPGTHDPSTRPGAR